MFGFKRKTITRACGCEEVMLYLVPATLDAFRAKPCTDCERLVLRRAQRKGISVDEARQEVAEQKRV